MNDEIFRNIYRADDKHKYNGAKTEESVSRPRDSLSKNKKLFDKILEDVCAGDFSGFVPENTLEKKKEDGEAASC